LTAIACKSCHDGRYLSEGALKGGALAKPSNHIPEIQLLNGAAMDCKACHTSTSAWSAQTMNHNSSMGSGAGWCKGCHLSGQKWAGMGETKTLNHRGSKATVIDCSQSGCHRPLGNQGTAYRSW
jgi:hypothetical protein